MPLELSIRTIQFGSCGLYMTGSEGCWLHPRTFVYRRGFIATLYLALAVVFEVIATCALKGSDGFTRVWPSAVTIVGYSVAFYGLYLCLRTMSVGIVYVLWSGLGTIWVSVAGWLVYEQSIDAPAVLGMALIVIGVAVIQMYSTSIHL